MGGINRFSKPAAPSRFSPLTFEEQSFAPVLLREREDALMNARDEILNQAANIEVPKHFQEAVDIERRALEAELNALAERIQKEGAGNLELVGEFRNLRNKYNKAVSATGNIGRAAGSKIDIDTIKAAFMTDAATKGRDSGIANIRFKEQVDKYYKGLPNDLSKYVGALPDFDAEFAPNKIDLIDEIIKMQGLVTGISEEKHGKFHFEEAPGEHGEAGGLIVVSDTLDENGDPTKMDNDIAINNLKEQLERTIFNPTSDVYRNLKWKHGDDFDPKEYLRDIDNYTNMMRKKSTTSITDYKGYIPGVKPTTGVNTPGKPTSNGKAVLQEAASGNYEIINSLNVTTSRAAIADIANNPNKTDHQKAQEITQLNGVLNQKLKLEDIEKAVTPEEKEKAQIFSETMASTITSNPYWTKRGVTNYDEYNQYIEADTEKINSIRGNISMINDSKSYLKSLNLTPTELQSLSQLSDEELLAQYDDPIEGSTMDKLINVPYTQETRKVAGGETDFIPKYVKGNVNDTLNLLDGETNDLNKGYSKLSNTLLEPSTFYTLGLEKDDGTFAATIDKNIVNLSTEALANTALFDIADKNGIFQINNKSNATVTEDAGDIYREFEAMNNDKAKWSMVGVTDGGLAHNSQLIFNVATTAKNRGTGAAVNKTFKVAIDLDPDNLTAITEQFLYENGTYYNLLNDHGQAVMDGIRDKARYGDVTTDLRFDMKDGDEIFDTEGSKSVKANSLQAWNKEYNINIKRDNTFLARKVFTNPRGPEDHAIVINEDDSFSNYKRDANGNVTAMDFGDYATKGVIVALAKNNALYSFEGDEAYWEKWGKQHFLHNTRLAKTNLKQIEASDAIFSMDPRYLEGLNKYDDLISTLSPKEIKSEKTMEAAAKIFDQYIAGLTISSRIIKEIL